MALWKNPKWTDAQRERYYENRANEIIEDLEIVWEEKQADTIVRKAAALFQKLRSGEIPKRDSAHKQRSDLYHEVDDRLIAKIVAKIRGMNMRIYPRDADERIVYIECMRYAYALRSYVRRSRIYRYIAVCTGLIKQNSMIGDEMKPVINARPPAKRGMPSPDQEYLDRSIQLLVNTGRARLETGKELDANGRRPIEERKVLERKVLEGRSNKKGKRKGRSDDKDEDSDDSLAGAPPAQ